MKNSDRKKIHDIPSLFLFFSFHLALQPSVVSSSHHPLRSQAFVDPTIVSLMAKNSIRFVRSVGSAESNPGVQSSRLSLPKFHHFGYHGKATPVVISVIRRWKMHENLAFTAKLNTTAHTSFLVSGRQRFPPRTPSTTSLRFRSKRGAIRSPGSVD